MWCHPPVLRVLEDHLGSQQVSRVIYGSIIGLALVVALEVHPPTAAQTLCSVFVGYGLTQPTCPCSEM